MVTILTRVCKSRLPRNEVTWQIASEVPSTGAQETPCRQKVKKIPYFLFQTPFTVSHVNPITQKRKLRHREV